LSANYYSIAKTQTKNIYKQPSKNGAVKKSFSRTIFKQKYQLGSSANVSIVKRALVRKELVGIGERRLVIPEPVMKVWLKKEFLNIKKRFVFFGGKNVFIYIFVMHWEEKHGQKGTVYNRFEQKGENCLVSVV